MLIYFKSSFIEILVRHVIPKFLWKTKESSLKSQLCSLWSMKLGKVKTNGTTQQPTSYMDGSK